MGGQISALNNTAACPGTGPRATAPPPCADRNHRRNAALRRRRLPGVRLDSCRDHPGPWALRQAHETSPAKKERLVPPPAKRLATHPQSVGSHPGAAGAGKHANKRITISSSPETRTVATVRPRRGTGDIGIIFPAESKFRKGAGDALCHAPPSIMRRRSPSDKMNVKRGRLSGAGAHARLPDQS